MTHRLCCPWCGGRIYPDLGYSREAEPVGFDCDGCPARWNLAGDVINAGRTAAEISKALQQIATLAAPATPAEARPDGMRVFPNVPCLTPACAGDLGHEGDCGPRPVAS